MAENLLHRFDTARIVRFHINLMLLDGFCWMWAAYGVTIVGFIIPVLKEEWHISATSLGWLAGIGMLGMLVGAVIAGSLSDHFGRRRMLVWIMAYLGSVFILSGLAQNYSILLVLRFLTGMALGAILPVGGTLLAEFSPSRQRGSLLVLQNAFWGLGGTLAALAGYAIVLKFGWRLAMFFGGLAGILAPLIHFVLPESVRYLLNKGKTELAIKEMARVRLMENEESVATLVSAGEVDEQAPSNKGIWSAGYLRITLSLWLLWFALNYLYQGVFIWLPTLLAGKESSTAHSFLVTLFISLGQIPGTVLVAWLADKFNRRNLVIFSVVMLGVSAVVFSLMQANILIVSMGFVLMVFNGMAWGLAHPFSTELYPTRLRGTATGWATGIGRLGGVVAPVVVASVMAAGGSMLVIFSIIATVPILAALLLLTMKQATTGKSLEEISS